jgi:hypothetical protein
MYERKKYGMIVVRSAQNYIFTNHKKHITHMRTSILAFVTLLITTATYAQNSNAILFAENGERFKVVLNGVLQNATAQTNVKLTDLPAPTYRCRILFEDTKLGYLDFSLYFPNQGYEVTWNIKKNKNGEYVARYVSDIPIAQAPPTPPSQPEIVYTTVPATTTTSTVYQQQTTTSGGGDNFNLNMGMNANDGGGNISINASGMDGGMHDPGYTTTTTTTTTHSVTTTSSGGTVSTSTPTPTPVVYVPGYSGNIGCPVPVSQNEFAQMKETIRSKTFEETKLTISKQILKDNCITSAQVREILGLFDFENTKLDFAKYAYSRTYDTGNYYKVNDAFEFESSVSDLNEYISK